MTVHENALTDKMTINRTTILQLCRYRPPNELYAINKLTNEGLSVGSELLGLKLGLNVGDSLGLLEGDRDGLELGDALGLKLGVFVGLQ